MISLTFDPTDDARLTVLGEIDLFTVPRLRQAVAGAQLTRATVRLDLAGVEFIDSAGIHALVAMCAEARHAGRTVGIENLSEPVDRMLRLTRTGHLVCLGQQSGWSPTC